MKKICLFYLSLFLANVTHLKAEEAPQKEETKPVIASHYEKYSQKHPDIWQGHYNLANSQYQAKDFKSAQANYDKALEHCSNPKEQERIFYNLGNAHYRQSQQTQEKEEKKSHLKQSINHYKSAQTLDPEAEDTKHNLECAEKALERLEKEEKKQDKQDNKQDNKQKEQDKNQNKNKDEDKNNPQKDDKKDEKKNEQQKQDQQNDSNQNKSQDNKQQNQGQGDEKKDEKQPENKEPQPAPQPQPKPTPQPKPQQQVGGEKTDQEPKDQKKQDMQAILKANQNEEKMLSIKNPNENQQDPNVEKDW